MKRYIRSAILTAALATQIAPAQVAPSPPSPAPDRPSVENFFKRASYADATLSPDGRYLATIVPLYERPNLALIDLSDRSIKVLTSLKQEGVVRYRWVGDGTIEVSTGNITDELSQVEIYQRLLLDTDGRVVRDFRRQARSTLGADVGGIVRRFAILDILDRDGNDLVVVANERNIYSLDAYRYDPRGNTKQLLTAKAPDGEVESYVSDHDGQVRIAVSLDRGATTQTLWTRRSNDDAWRKLREWPAEEDDIQPIAFDYDNRTLYVAARSKDGTRTAALYRFDPDAGRLADKVFEEDGFDVDNVVFDRNTKKLIGVRTEAGQVAWLDPQWVAVQRTVDQALPGMRNSLSAARYATDRIVVRSESESTSPSYYLYDRSAGRIEFIASARPWLDKVTLGARKFVRYAARDGLSIPAYLTLPAGVAPKNLPLVVVIHGGPYVPGGRFGFDVEAHFLASRGYAVLEPDFRGTQGYGDAFYKAGWRQWGLAMQDDVTDGVKWLEATGVADPDRVCLFGASYGGYATLWGLEKEPQMFRCGVAFVAVSDLELMFDVNWSDFMGAEHGGNTTNTLTRWIGDPDKDREKMRAVSPLRHADRIQAPLLLAYGSADTRVPLVHGTRMRAALDEYKKPYEWVVYTDEWHGFNKDENKFDFYRRVDAFLEKNLKPHKSVDAQAAAAPQ